MDKIFLSTDCCHVGVGNGSWLEKLDLKLFLLFFHRNPLSCFLLNDLRVVLLCCDDI